MRMNSLDVDVISFLNSFAHQSRIFDSFVILFVKQALLKGGIFVSMLWWAWFRQTKPGTVNREHIIPTLIVCVVAVFIARAVALITPYRARPLHTSGFQLQLPYTMDPETLANWSSFPSDHAALFFALATGICLFSRRLGVFAFLYAFFVICLPRIYAGLHWPTDIIAGALIGIGVAFWGNALMFRNFINGMGLRWIRKSPSSFYTCFFLWTYQIATLFDDTRAITSFAYHSLRQLFGGIVN